MVTKTPMTNPTPLDRAIREAVEAEREQATPDLIAIAWQAWHSRHGGKLGPGPAFVEAINAVLAAIRKDQP